MAEVVHIASARGVDRARIVLHPDSLGGIEVRLEHGAGGLRATLHVEHVDALATLQSGLGELRRGLEARGVTVETLDLSLAPGHGGEREERNGAAGGDGSFGAPRPGDVDPLAPGDDPTLTTTTASTDRPAAGVLVDVMA
ncbi:MAG: flagellar hook-length control protein FliK [Solirubrobacteraceae bacterium]|nr:flagellar hook-length control protein FliK [Solirubrobacteraceae bacterium]